MDDNYFSPMVPNMVEDNKRSESHLAKENLKKVKDDVFSYTLQSVNPCTSVL